MYFQRLKDLREDKEFKQDEMASKLNCKRSTYANWENGTIIIPLDIADELSILYNVSLSYVLELSNDRNINYKQKKIDYKFLRAKLLSLKIENKHTYEIIADYIRTARSTCYRYFNGFLSIPTDKLILLCNLYKIDIDELCNKK
ncbi:MAG: helix-turn-helix transcriptional regulator [Tissierellia bacterium]|nr:helix-turn-helix transcriptional regulator [Tissierellia bacterium]